MDWIRFDLVSDLDGNFLDFADIWTVKVDPEKTVLSAGKGLCLQERVWYSWYVLNLVDFCARACSRFHRLEAEEINPEPVLLHTRLDP